MNTVTQCLAFDPDSLWAAYHRTLRLAEDECELGSNLGKLVPNGDWSGEAADACERRILRISAKTQRVVEPTRELLAAWEPLIVRFARATGRLKSSHARLTEQDIEVDDTTGKVIQKTVTVPGGAPDVGTAPVHTGPMADPGDMIEFEESFEEINRCDAEMARILTLWGQEAIIPIEPGSMVYLKKLTNEELAIATASIPPAKMIPSQVARWWRSLSARAQQALINRHAFSLHMLNGLPPAVADKVNRKTLIANLSRLEKLNMGGSLSEAESRQLATARNIVAQLKRVQETGKPAYLLGYYETAVGNRGNFSIAIGNPETARNVALRVPGMDTRASSLSVTDELNLHDEMTKIDGAEQCVIIDYHYHAPIGINQASMDDYVDNGDQNYGRDLQVLHEYVRPEANVTAIGHSYGSTTISKAMLHGGSADNLILVGSPGAGVHSASDFKTVPAGHVYVGAIDTDPVAQLGRFTSPAYVGPMPQQDNFHAHVFETASGVSPAHAHSAYFDPGSKSLGNMAKIATGHYSAVTMAG